MSLPSLESVYVTDECIRQWKSGNTSFRVSNQVQVLRFLYELCWAMVRGELPIQRCKFAIDSAEFTDRMSNAELGSNLVDVVTQLSLDLMMPGEYRSRLINLAKWLVESSIVPVRLFQERCEEDFLWEAEMIKIKAQDLKGKEVRVNTRLLYQQTKFNLLREESEGYAKLATLLCRGSEDATQNSAATIGIIKSLIGHFDLDPNRVFDIVLDCFELQLDNNVFLELIPIFPKSHASQILGFKFQYYQRMEIETPVPFNLYKLTALLVKEEFIDLDSIYLHLLPKDEEALEHYFSFSTKRLDEANKIGKINLAATGKDLMDDEKQADVSVDLFVAVNMEAEAVAERSLEFDSSQPLGLIAGFLSVDDWHHAYILLDRLSSLNPVAHVMICDGLFRMIEKSISSAYNIVRQAHLQTLGSLSGAAVGDMDTENSSNPVSFVNLSRELFQMLATAGAYLHRDTLLLQKVCRVLRGHYLSAVEGVGNDDRGADSQLILGANENPRMHLKEVQLRVEEALGTCLLPSLQLIPANPAVGQEIWEVMSLLPYEARYRLYGEWEKEDEKNPMVLVARQTAKLDTRRILKRLAKENLKQLGRMVAKLAHANPMTVLRTIVHQIEAYRDMITPVVDAFKYLTQLEYDILEYVVIERLSHGGRDKLKDDGLNLSDWLQSLASFWGHLCKKYPSMELRGLFQYLVNQLKRGQGIELVLLQELVQQMANVQYTENLTEEQLDAMAGSDTLRYQATSFGVTRNNKALIKSTNRLRDALIPKDEPKLAVPLLLLIAQHRSGIVTKSDAPYIKMVSEQFDRCHGTLLQYVDFLCSAMTQNTAYAQLIPSLSDLVHLYHLDPEVAFLIYRPVMRLFKCEGSSDVFWPSDDNYAAKSTIGHTEDTGSDRKPTMSTDLFDTVKTMLPSKAWNSLSPDLYATFWGLTLYDLYVPRKRYESEITKQHAALKALEELSDNSSSAITKRKKDKERIQESLDRLTNELRGHEETVASVRRRLSREKENWLSSCPDTLKINMEFLQRCIFPRCTFSMPDAVYCALFVHTLHSLGTPYFNTVNHIDVLICKTLQPMICCCTEYEVGRLGRFLYETLKIAYYWKSDESIYERECADMPGFAVYYRYPNSQRVTYGQFIKVHWKWSQRITRLLIQCLESNEYMEIRNALIMLTKISGVFPVTRKSGINLEKRVAKIKSDEREDLKVLATGVAAALAARKSSWVTDEEFGMGYLELKPASSVAARPLAGNVVAVVQNGIALNVPQSEYAGGRSLATVTQHVDSRSKPADVKLEKESPSVKSDQIQLKSKGGPSVNGPEVQGTLPSAAGQAGTLRLTESKKQIDEFSNKTLDEGISTVALKSHADSEIKASTKRSVPAASLSKTPKPDLSKEESKSGKVVVRSSSALGNEKDHSTHTFDSRQAGPVNISLAASVNNSSKGPATEFKGDFGVTRPDVRKDSGSEVASRLFRSPMPDNPATTRSSDKQQKRSSPADEPDRLGKRRKGEIDSRDLEGEIRFSDKLVDFDKTSPEELAIHRAIDNRSKDKGNERYDRDYRENDDLLAEKIRERSIERYGRERSLDRNSKDERIRDDRSKLRYADDKSHFDERSHGQNLPPPPPLPLHAVSQFHHTGRRDEEADRRLVGTTRHAQRLSPQHEEKERRWSEENSSTSRDIDAKRRREEELRERKRDERDSLSIKVEERDREREKANFLKEEIDANNAALKKRKIKRDQQLPSIEAGEYTPEVPPTLATAHAYDGRDRGDRRGGTIQRIAYSEEPVTRIHGKEVVNKMTRRDTEQMYDREWDEEKRQRLEPKRRHRK